MAALALSGGGRTPRTTRKPATSAIFGGPDAGGAVITYLSYRIRPVTHYSGGTGSGLRDQSFPGYAAEKRQDIAGSRHDGAVRPPVTDVDQSRCQRRKVTEERGDLLPGPDRRHRRSLLGFAELMGGLRPGLRAGAVGWRYLDMTDDQVAARGQGVAQPRHGPSRVCLIGNEVQRGDDQQGDRLIEVDQPEGLRRPEDLLGRVRSPRMASVRGPASRACA